MTLILMMLKASLPLWKIVAARTPNKVDDAIVELLEGIVNNPDIAPQLVTQAKASGQLPS